MNGGEPVENRGVFLVSGRVGAEGTHYSITGPDNGPWSDFGAFGKILTRDEANADPFRDRLFH